MKLIKFVFRVPLFLFFLPFIVFGELAFGFRNIKSEWKEMRGWLFGGEPTF